MSPADAESMTLFFNAKLLILSVSLRRSDSHDFKTGCAVFDALVDRLAVSPKRVPFIPRFQSLPVQSVVVGVGRSQELKHGKRGALLRGQDLQGFWFLLPEG